MFKNQYLLTTNNEEKKINEEILIYYFYHIYIYAHCNLNVTIRKNNDFSIALIGYIIDPLNPKKNNTDIIEDLTQTNNSLNDFLDSIQIFSGRFVLLIKLNKEFYILGDCCSLRQIQYGYLNNIFIATSSINLFLNFFNLDIMTSKEKEIFINDKQYLKNESAWIGDDTLDDRLKRLLPNQIYNISLNKVSRLPQFHKDFMKNEEEITKYCMTILKGTYEAISIRYSILQPITAGWDSRLLLSASKDQRNKIKYYIFGEKDSTKTDIVISKKLSEKLCLNFSIFEPKEIEVAFLEKFSQENTIPRILPKTSHIQFHFKEKYNNKTINISGVGGEIMRTYFGISDNKKIDEDIIMYYSKYSKANKFINNHIQNWFRDAKNYSILYNIPILDLFYWEQRMGNWGGQFPFEQDIALEECAPLNNRSLVYSILNIPSNQRCAPHYLFFYNLINKLWDETLSEPINPDQSKIKALITRDSKRKYYLMKIYAILKGNLS